jgi:hypothetical protein
MNRRRNLSLKRSTFPINSTAATTITPLTTDTISSEAQDRMTSNTTLPLPTIASYIFAIKAIRMIIKNLNQIYRHDSMKMASSQSPLHLHPHLKPLLEKIENDDSLRQKMISGVTKPVLISILTDSPLKRFIEPKFLLQQAFLSGRVGTGFLIQSLALCREISDWRSALEIYCIAKEGTYEMQC